jgi:hypothetical protein
LNYTKTILGILAGVFLALSVSQVFTTLNILQSTKNDIYSCRQNTRTIIDSIPDTIDDNSYKNIPIVFIYKPNTVIEILKMERVLEQISHRTIEQLSRRITEMNTLYDKLNDTSGNFKIKGYKYLINLKISFNLLYYEIMYMRKEISHKDLNFLIDKDIETYKDSYYIKNLDSLKDLYKEKESF